MVRSLVFSDTGFSGTYVMTAAGAAAVTRDISPRVARADALWIAGWWGGGRPGTHRTVTGNCDR